MLQRHIAFHILSGRLQLVAGQPTGKPSICRAPPETFFRPGRAYSAPSLIMQKYNFFSTFPNIFHLLQSALTTLGTGCFLPPAGNVMFHLSGGVAKISIRYTSHQSAGGLSKLTTRSPLHQFVGLQRGAALRDKQLKIKGCTTLQPYNRYRLILIRRPTVFKCKF